MKVGSSIPPSRPVASRPVGRAEAASRADAASAIGAYGGAPTVGRISNPEDKIEILGINPADLSPKVRDTMLMLLEEVDGLKRQLDSTNRRVRELEELADLDALLPIRNRRAFVRELSRMISYAERYATPSTIMFIDLNDMKTINDSYGHEAGDQALFHLSRILNENLRGTDIVGRLGGDEFGVILTQADEIVGAEKAKALAEKVMSIPMTLQAKSDSGDMLDNEIKLRMAYGLYTIRGGEDAGDALEKADEAMYANKKLMKGEENVR